MSEIKYILILANSEREGGRCVAGKLAMPLESGNFHVGQQWIRLNNPGSTGGGAVPWQQTRCRPDGIPLQPLDIVKVTLLTQCNNPDHPEDWNYDPMQPWEWVGAKNITSLATMVDSPPTLWHDGNEKSVRAGYIPKMARPASLYLVKATQGWAFEYFKEWNHTTGRDKKRRRLKMVFNGRRHDFAITDSSFDKRFNLPDDVSGWPNIPARLTMANSDNIYFCLSLTGLTPPDFISHHYKICATIFES